MEQIIIGVLVALLIFPGFFLWWDVFDKFKRPRRYDSSRAIRRMTTQTIRHMEDIADAYRDPERRLNELLRDD